MEMYIANLNNMSFEKPINEEMEKKVAEAISPDQAKLSEYREAGLNELDSLTQEISSSFSYDQAKDLASFKYAGHKIEMYRYTDNNSTILVDGVEVKSSAPYMKIIAKFDPVVKRLVEDTVEIGSEKKLKQALDDILGDTSK